MPWSPHRARLAPVWIQLSNWIAGDDGLDLGVGDPWSTVLDAYSEGAEVVDSSTPLGLDLADELPFSAGPTYDIVGRTFEDESAGTCLDTGSAILTPHGYHDWPLGIVLKMRSELRGGWYPTIPPPDVLLYSGTIRQVLVRWWKAVSTGEPHSYRADPDTVQFRPIDRMNSFYDGKSPDSDARVISDYLVELS
jgi:hypothetical protein